MSLKITRVAQAIASIAACAMAAAAHAKPIAFAHGTTVMGEYGAGTMTELQAFYAPTFRYSLGGGHLSLDSDVERRHARHHVLARATTCRSAGTSRTRRRTCSSGAASGARTSARPATTSSPGMSAGSSTTRRAASTRRCGPTFTRRRVQPSHRHAAARRRALRARLRDARGLVRGSRRATTPAGCSTAPSGRLCCGCSSATPGSKPARPTDGKLQAMLMFNF